MPPRKSFLNNLGPIQEEPVDGNGFRKRSPLLQGQNQTQFQRNPAGQDSIPQSNNLIGQRTQRPPNNLVDFQNIKNTGLQGIQDQALGKSPFLDKLEQEQLNRLGLSQTSNTAAMQQQFAQQGLDPATRNALALQASRQQDIARGQVSGDIANIRAQQQEEGQQQAFQAGTQAEQMERQQLTQQYQDLINAGGIDNLARAEQVYGQLFPGSDLDTHRVKQDQVTSALGAYASIPGATVESAIQMAQEQGDLDFYGISPEDAKRIIEPIVEGATPLGQATAQYKTMLGAGQINQEQFDDLVAIQQFQITNPEGIERRDSYIVTDKDGNTVGNFLTETEAKDFSAKEGGEVKFTKDGYIGVKGEYQEFVPVGDGEFFSRGEKLYKVVDGQKILAEPTFDDPFSRNNEEILDFYDKSGDKPDEYKRILKLQADRAVNDPNELPDDFSENSRIYKSILKNQNVKSIDRPRRSHESGSGSKSVKKINAFEGLPENSFINVDNRLLIFKSAKKNVRSGDDLMEYTFYDPIRKKSITYKTIKRTETVKVS